MNNIIVKAPLMADKIKELLETHDKDGVSFKFVSKTGMNMEFEALGGEGADMAALVKNIVKATDFGKGLFFSVTEK